MNTFLHLRKTLGVAAFGLALLPTISWADITFNYGLCNPSDGCNQSVNFTPSAGGSLTGITVTGDTNPAPVYNVYVQSLQDLTLHGTGSVVDNNAGGGFNSILIRPEAGYTWGAIDFNLDSNFGKQPTGTSGLTLTAYDSSNVAWTSPNMNFPWEGNNGENQQYTVRAINGQVITSLTIAYWDPLGAGNTINDIHNIDVNTMMIPEPETYAMLLAGLGLMGFIARRRKLNESA